METFRHKTHRSFQSGLPAKLGITLALILLSHSLWANKTERRYRKAKEATKGFIHAIPESKRFGFRADTLKIDFARHKLSLEMNAAFAEIPFRTASVEKYYTDYRKALGRPFRKFDLSIFSMGKEIHQLIPNVLREASLPIDQKRLIHPLPATKPFVANLSKDLHFKNGLENRHITLWQSHGWYYENTLDRWEWQRARVFLTVEDLWTMSFVVPYLTPMLENAGATVWMPRERDIQSHEVIVDADGSSAGSQCLEQGAAWQTAPDAGFGYRFPFLFDGENPFGMGHSRKISVKPVADASVKYLPSFPAEGDYAVYVSYHQSEDNCSDARYTVFHAGGQTSFSVDQTKGGGTWIYLGTFHFQSGQHPETGSVVLSNGSSQSGKWLSADAVRFGGGMGNIVRGNDEQLKKLYSIREQEGFKTDSVIWRSFASQRPRYQEAARYFLQYAGFPDSLVYSLNKTKIDYANRGSDAALYANRENGKEDYKDDYMGRGEYVNFLMGDPNGPTKAPHAKGMGIPVDLSMAFHTDAGTTPDSSIIGSLVIYDTTFDRDTFPNGQSKWASRDLADLVQTQVVQDLRARYKADWTRRGMWNKRYFEAARPKVPALLSELLSHQNFADMYLAQDPRFKFDVCRAFYKGILKFVAGQNGFPAIVEPLPVDHFAMSLDGKSLRLSWKPVSDPLEPTAEPTAYRVYIRKGNGGFDNGHPAEKPVMTLTDLEPGVIYSFKVTALNAGGESFPSEILACALPVDGSDPALIVNGFDRICAPAAFDNGKEAGFKMEEDEGVAYQQNLAFIGNQYDFNRKSEWLDDDAPGFGASDADMESRIIPGNLFDYAVVHGAALLKNGKGFVSMSDESFEELPSANDHYCLYDLIFGEEKTTTRLIGIPGKDFTLFTPAMQKKLTDLSEKEGTRLLISGAYIGSDLALCGDTLAAKFAAKVLHYTLRSSHASKSGEIYTVNNWRQSTSQDYHYIHTWHPTLYKVEAPDAIEPAGKNASVLFRYAGDNKSAGTFYEGRYKVVSLCTPIETIATNEERERLMKQLLELLK
ncbi:MAG: fibronectin type III domain-containing protein [Marinilabiliales bacterium]|nr:fibronectin type III domain-containing protein [Marinilabiliales bacterium]